MKSRTVYQMLAVVGFCGLIVELANANPWGFAVATIVAAVWFCTSAR